MAYPYICMMAHSQVRLWGPWVTLINSYGTTECLGCTARQLTEGDRPGMCRVSVCACVCVRVSRRWTLLTEGDRPGMCRVSVCACVCVRVSRRWTLLTEGDRPGMTHIQDRYDTQIQDRHDTHMQDRLNKQAFHTHTYHTSVYVHACL